MSYAVCLTRSAIASPAEMRALCRTLDAVDTQAIAAGDRACSLVVREATAAGQGWWVGKVQEMGYQGSGPVSRRRPLCVSSRSASSTTGARSASPGRSPARSKRASCRSACPV